MTKPRSWMTVWASTTPGGRLFRFAPPAFATRSTTTPPRTPRNSPATSASGPKRGGQRCSLASFTRCRLVGPLGALCRRTFRDGPLQRVESRDHAHPGRGLADGVACVAVAAQPDRLDPARPRALDVLVEAVADVDRFAGAGPGERERGGEQRAGGLRRADLGGGRDAVEKLAQAGLAQHAVQRDVPVARHDEPRPGGAPALERRGHLGKWREMQAVQQRRHEVRRWTLRDRT